MKIKCCIDHVEQVLDEIVFECEEAPYLKKIDEKEPKEKCKYCDQESIYLVENEFSDTKCE